MNGKQLKNSILQWAIQGRLVPQDPADEPASVLLERIRAEKAKLVKEGKLKKNALSDSVIFRGEDNKYYEKNGKTLTCIDEDIPFEIPETWEWVRLPQIAISELGKTLDKAKNRGQLKPYLCSINIHWSGIDLSCVKQTKFEDAELDRYLLQKGDLLICEGGDVGRSAVWESKDLMCYQNALHRVRFYSKINPYYFKSVMEAYKGMEILDKKAKGMTIKHLVQSSLNALLLPLPPLAEQRRIVAKVEEVMSVVERYEKAQEELDVLCNSLDGRLRKSILSEAIQGRLVPQNPTDEPASVLLEHIRAEKAKLVKEGKLKKTALSDSVIFRGEDNKYYEKNGKTITCINDQIPFEIPEAWEWCRLGSVGDWGAGATPSKGNASYYGGNILWLRTGELNDGIVYDTEIKITDKALNECSLRLNKVGDVLIAMYGATIGKVAIAGCELTTNQACCACTPIGIYNYYLFFFLMASKKDFIKKGEGGAQPNISREKLVTHLFPLPPLPEQHRIVAKVEELFAVLDRLACK